MNPDIKTVADLKGRSSPSVLRAPGVYFNAIDVLGAYGMTEADITRLPGFGDSAESLKDKKIDAAFIVAGAPTTAIVDLSTSAQRSTSSASMTSSMDTLLASQPYSAYTIAADCDVYRDVQTVAVAAVVLVRDDVSDDDVHLRLHHLRQYRCYLRAARQRALS